MTPLLLDAPAGDTADDVVVVEVAPTGVSLWRKIGRVAARLLFAFILFQLVGNGLIVGAWKLQTFGHVAKQPEISIDNFRVVDAQLWRGAAPGNSGYRELAAAGARTIVDLRAEHGIDVDTELLDDLGLDLVRIPIRDGQTPTTAEVTRFLEAVRDSRGPVFVHCGAGVGRTGTMVAAYLVNMKQASGRQALEANLGVGPPSLEQIVFAANLEKTEIDRPSRPIVVVSRILDAPRRIWSRLRS